MNAEITEFLNNLRNDLKKDMEENRIKSVEEIKEHINVIDNKVKTAEGKIKNIEREIRRKNVIIFGADGEACADFWELERFVCNFLQEKLNVNVDERDIDFVRLIGKKNNTKNRPILLGLTSFRSKLLIMQNANKLRGSNVFIAHDYPKDIVEIRKRLQPQLKDARQEGKFAVLKYDKLIVKDVIESENNKKRTLPPQDLHEQHQSISNSLIAKKNKVEDKSRVKARLQSYVYTPGSPTAHQPKQID